MSISMPAIAVLEAVVILCLLGAMTWRRQAAAMFAGIGARALFGRGVGMSPTGPGAKYARMSRKATPAGRFDAPPRAFSGDACPESRHGTAAFAITPGDNPGASAARRPFGTRLRTLASVSIARRHTANHGEGSENGQRLDADAAAQANAERYFCEIVALLPFAILLLDERGLIRTANPQTARLFGYEGDELIGMPVGSLVPDLSIALNPARANIALALPQSRNTAPAQELSAHRKDGTEFRVEIGLNAFRFVEGVTLAFIIDRTDRYELHRNRQDLAHLMRVSTIGQLASSLAHEINQPLTAILSNVQAAQRFMAADPIDLAEIRDILNDIVQDDYRASEVIRRIRAVVKKGDLEIAPLDLAAVIRDAIHLLHSDAIVRSVRVTLDLANDLPPVCADKVQLQQVMLNLLLNAFDAMNEVPPVDRAVLVTLGAAEHRSVCIAVSDKGHGLTSDKLDKIFKPFVTSKPQGLGLGLSISRSIIDMHHGRLWAKNNRDRGATFYVTLPVGDATDQRELCQ